MNVALRTREQFLDWVFAQERRFEFDGLAPVPMHGGTFVHTLIAQNIFGALRSRLRGSAFRVVGPEMAVATVGQAVRFPDAIVVRLGVPNPVWIVTEVVVAFEVVSASSVRMDRVTKVREYFSSPSIGTYVIVEQDAAAITVLERVPGGATWAVTALEAGDTLSPPELGVSVSVPVADFYEDTRLIGGTP